MKYIHEVDVHKLDFSEKDAKDKFKRWCESHKLFWKVSSFTGGGLMLGKYKDKMIGIGGDMDWGSVFYITYDGEEVKYYAPHNFRYKPKEQ